MESKSDSSIVSIAKRLVSVIPEAQQILSGSYEPRIAFKWYVNTIQCYQKIYGSESTPYKVLFALREKLQKKTADPALIKATVNEFLALANFLSNCASSNSSALVSRASIPPSTKQVFIIHGHDELNTLRLKAMLKENFSLDVIVMGAKPGGSQPIIDKFEENAKLCTFAFALFTPDDLVVKGEKENYHQARPNVTFETGWFVGRLGKERVLILLKEGAKIYSDFDGVHRVQYSENVQDVFLQIQKELKTSCVI